MALTRRDASGKQAEDTSMLLKASFVSLAIAITAGVLASPVVSLIPESVGWAVGGPALLSTFALLTIDPLIRRRRDRERYWEAGFLVEPRDHMQQIEDFIAFVFGGGGLDYSDCWYRLPEAPQFRTYDFFYRTTGMVRGHLVVAPTSAPTGVAARHTSVEAVAARVYSAGPLVSDASGVVRSPGEEHNDLVRALPEWRGMLRVTRGRARWLTFEKLTPDEIKTVIACLQRLPPPGGDSATLPQED